MIARLKVTVCLLRHAPFTFLKTPFLRVMISTFKSGWKERKGRATCIPEQLGGLKSGLEVSSASSQLLNLQVPAVSPGPVSFPAAILTSQHLACGITLSSQALPPYSPLPAAFVSSPFNGLHNKSIIGSVGL